MNPDLAPVKPGEVLAGRYRVERVLGFGGMGVVVAATHVALDQSIAIKFLLPHALMHPEVVQRFEREARAAVRIRSEHVSRVMDVGKLENGAPYMVMEYLEGRDLYAELRARGRLDTTEAVDYVLQACEAVAEAHKLGIVHRDLKPANLFVVDHHGMAFIKVLDFGISKIGGVGGADAGGMTQSASLLGSPSYMSPEQITSARTVDARSDVWALGVILFELVTGRTPFTGDSVPEVCMAITQRPTPSVRSLYSDVPPAFEAVVSRCLEKDRDKRYASVDALAQALAPLAPARSRLSLERIGALAGRSPSQSGVRVETVASGFPMEGSGGVPAQSADTEPGPSTAAGWGHTAAEKKGRSRTWMIWAAALAGAGTAGGLALRGVMTAGQTPTTVGSNAAPASAVPANTPARSTPVATEPAPVASGPPLAGSAAPPASEAPPPEVSPAPSMPSARVQPPQIRQTQPRTVPPARKVVPAPAAPPAKKPSESWEDDR